MFYYAGIGYGVSSVCRLSVCNACIVSLKGTVMKLLDRAITNFYRLLIVTMFLSAAIWRQF